MKITVKTLFGLEDILIAELAALGITDVRKGHRVVFFEGDLETLYKCNYHLRTALRVLVELKFIKVHSIEDIYQAVKRIKWTNFLTLGKTFAIDSVVSSEFFTHSLYVGLKCKDAIADQFRQRTGKRPNVDIKTPDVKINIHIYERDMTISLDSSGPSLHKRGYKMMSVAAPINEVLAAGILKLIEWDKNTPLYDPMCGSGTFPIESYMLSRNIAPQKFRPYFCLEKWMDFDEDLWEGIKASAKKEELTDGPKIEGSDLLHEAIKAATRNVRPFRRTKNLKLKQEDFFDKEFDENSTIIMNPPYDNRLELSNIIEHYGDIGDYMKHNMKNCKVWIFSGNIDAIKHVGLKTFKKIELRNGTIKSKLHGFDIY